MTIILVTGSRYWNNKEIIKRELLRFHATKIIQGGAKGADTQAKEVGNELGIEVIQVDAEWDRYGKVAGPIRNEQMITDYHPDLVLAFHNDIQSSRGTKNMIHIAGQFRIMVKLVSE